MAQRGVGVGGGIVLLFLDLVTGRGWLVSTTSRPLYPRKRPGAYCTGGWVGPRAGLDVRRKVTKYCRSEYQNITWNLQLIFHIATLKLETFSLGVILVMMEINSVPEAIKDRFGIKVYNLPKWRQRRNHRQNLIYINVIQIFRELENY
jgi:hypothetical protein